MNRSTFSSIGAAAVLLFLSTLSLQAQSCIGELKPLKPLACQDAAPVCLCDESGGNCRWIWSCAPSGYSSGSRRAVEEPQQRRPAGGIDTSIYQMLQPPVDTGGSLLEKYMQFQAIRNMQQQNRMLENQNRMIERMDQEAAEARRAALAQPSPTPSSFVPDNDGPGWTEGYTNGWRWRRMGRDVKIFWLLTYQEGIAWETQKPEHAASQMPQEITFAEIQARVDKFYDDPLNRPIPIPSTLSWLRLQEKGADEAMLQRFLLENRELANTALAKATQR